MVRIDGDFKRVDAISKCWGWVPLGGTLILSLSTASCGGGSSVGPPLQQSALWFADPGIPASDSHPASPLIGEFAVTQLRQQKSPAVGVFKVFHQRVLRPTA